MLYKYPNIRKWHKEIASVLGMQVNLRFQGEGLNAAGCSISKTIVVTPRLASIINRCDSMAVLLLGHEFGHIYYKHEGNNLYYIHFHTACPNNPIRLKERQADCFAGHLLKRFNLCPHAASKLFTEVLPLSVPPYPDLNTRCLDVAIGLKYEDRSDLEVK